MKQRLYVFFLISISTLLFASNSQAIIIDFQQNKANLMLHDSLGVDIMVSELSDETVSSFDLYILFDPSVLAATNVTFGPYLGEPFFFEALTDFSLTTPGVVDLAELSLLYDNDLANLQPDSFVLASVSFDAIGLGSTTLDFRFDKFNDIKGRDAVMLAVDSSSAAINVTGPGTGHFSTFRKRHCRNPVFLPKKKILPASAFGNGTL